MIHLERDTGLTETDLGCICQPSPGYQLHGHIQPEEHVHEIEKMPVPASVRLRLVGNGGE